MRVNQNTCKDKKKSDITSCAKEDTWAQTKKKKEKESPNRKKKMKEGGRMQNGGFKTSRVH